MGSSEPISAFVLDNEAVLRAAVFLGVLAVMATAEAAAPRRSRTRPRGGRWLANLGLVVIDTLAVRLLVPLAAVGVAAAATAGGWGLLNLWRPPYWLAMVVSLLVLDLAIYAQHVAFHKLPWLWRLHRVHHIDLDIDATTGLRFHPVEILLSMAFKMAVVAALGAPVVAVILFEVILNGMALFNHANLRLPLGLDRLLRLLVVTPDMHRVHHSVIRAETDSNYGFNLPWWDRLFGTYTAQPAAGHLGMTIGQPDWRTPAEQRLDRLLLHPFAPAKAPPPADAAGDPPR